MYEQTKKIFILATTILSITLAGTTAVMADDDPKPQKVTKITSNKKTITVGSEFELTAATSPRNADDDYLRWSIIGKKGIIKFDDDDRNDDEAEFKALRAGTTKVRCYIKGKSNSYSKTFTVTVKKAPASSSWSLTRIGKAARTVEVDDDLELKVKKNKSYNDKYLKWTIKNTKLLRFEDGDRYGSEVELEARRTGTTTVTCKNTKSGKSVTFTVRIVPDNDRDDD